MKRRSFLRASVAALSTPAILTGTARAQYGYGTNYVPDESVQPGPGVQPNPVPAPAPTPDPAPTPAPQNGEPGRRVRRNVQQMAANDPWFTDYAEAVDAMHRLPESDLRSWRAQTLIHLHFCPHNASDFAAWHRHYLRWYEDICATLIGKPDFALAYWNWTENQGRIPGPFFSDSRLNVQTLRDRSQASSPNAGGRTIQTVGARNIGPGTGLATLAGGFTQAAMDAIQRQSNFNTFQAQLESQPHNTAHGIIGGANGHMGDFMSPLDPIFWLHHCNVDRLWAEWQSMGNVNQLGNSRYDGQFVDGDSGFHNETEQGAGDWWGMNYTYANNAGQTLRPAPGVGTTSILSGLGGQLGMLAGTPQLTMSNVRAGVSATANAGVARLSVPAPDLLPQLFSSRVFLTPDAGEPNTVGVEGRRILLDLKNVSSTPEARGTVVDVFVNSPDLGMAEANPNHPGYAGTFGFFMAGMSHNQNFVIDVTAPLRRLAASGELKGDAITVQLIPKIDDPRVAPRATFTVGEIEMLST